MRSIGILARRPTSGSMKTSWPGAPSRVSIRLPSPFIAIHGQCAQLWQVAPLPAVGASMKVTPGRRLRIWWMMPPSVATMYSRAPRRSAAWMIPVVEPTASASAITARGDSGCTSTLACGCSAFSSSSCCALNSSWTTHEAFHMSMSAPVTRCT